MEITAEQLKQKIVNGQDNNGSIQMVTFEVGKEEFGFDIGMVQEIITPIRITKVPNSRKFIIGVINLRGKIIPIFDLKERIKGLSLNLDADTRIIVVHKDETSIGLLVSKVNEVALIKQDELVNPSDKLNNLQDNYISKIANLENRLISILDLEQAVFSREKELI